MSISTGLPGRLQNLPGGRPDALKTFIYRISLSAVRDKGQNMGIHLASRRGSLHAIAGLGALAALMFGAVPVQAAGVLNSCTTYCHGMPLRDTAARKANLHFNSQSSSFPGNHQTHLKPAPAAGDCSVCHKPVAPTDFGHQNNIIEMANSLKGYSTATLRARYNKGVFFNQTSIPNLTNAACSNVNCHFENVTPVWGSAAYAAPAACGACHGAPPAGGTGGTAGSHARHDAYFPGTANCQKCHPNSTSFIHATSAGRPIKVQGFLRTPQNVLDAGATYSGTGANYLPSKSAAQVFGTCTNIYCHSSGQNPTNGTATGITYKSVVWGSASLTCAGCHADEATDTTGTGSHKVHTISTGANYDCAKCHLGYTKTTVATATHVNGLVELGAAGFTYSQGSGASHPAANGYGTCSASVCHGSGTVTWGGTLWSTTDQCGKCHSSTAAGAISQTVPFYSTSYPTKVTVNTDAKVGAHTNHMTSQALGISASTACADCHGTVTLNSATHMSGATNFVWSNLATKSGALVPAYNTSTGQCTATYCHGNSMPGGDATGSNKSPIWKDPNYLPATISAAGCGTCHGFPPSTASGHPGGITIPAGFPGTATIGTTCSCHSNINSAGNSFANIFVNPALHINGILETPSGGHSFPFGGSLHLSAAGTTPWSGCTSCHANTAGGTYPVAAGTAPNCTGCHVNGLKAPSGTSSCWDCHGASATDGKPNGKAFPNISGNHTVHVTISGTTCATCHTGGGTGTATHGSSNRVAATAASVKVAFTGQGTSPLWTLASKTCSTTFCHGQGAPTWGARAGATVNGFPYSSAQCGKCHSGNLATDVTAAKPFYSTAIPQVTANTNAKVGAHTSHLAATDSLANAFVCADCHGTVTLTSATHMNGTTNFAWSTLATKGGALTPTYTASTGVCANVYCHGASMPGGDTSGTNRAPTWNSSTYLPATLTAAACGTCHGFPPPTSAGHPAVTIPAGFPATATIGTTCSCHSNINTAGNSYANIFVNKALHINGTIEVSGGHAVPNYNHQSAGTGSACTGCHAIGTATSVYPAAVAGNAPDCRGCHKKAAPGTATGTSATYGACGSCHGSQTATTAATQGRPNGTAFPDKAGHHSSGDSAHTSAACSKCHLNLGTAGGTGSGVNHGPGNRGTNPNVVGPGFAAGITVTGATKGISPTVNCNHTTIGSGCSGGGSKTW
jgi:predicted CxxxxCH...CXXCH cytochrome family protein